MYIGSPANGNNVIKPVFFSVFALSFIHNLFVVAHYITAIVVWQAYDCCLDDTVLGRRERVRFFVHSRVVCSYTLLSFSCKQILEVY